MIEGVKVKIGEQEYEIPALNFPRLKKVMALQTKLVGETGEKSDQVDAMTEIIFIAVQRNYPDIKREEIEDSLDMLNVNGILDEILFVSGLKKRPTLEVEQI